MRIAAIMMVRDEHAILATTIGHLLQRVGVDEVLVADNGSTDATCAILKRLAAMDARVRWMDATGPWDLSHVLSGLAREAHQRGNDWVIPTDADEFLWSRADNLRSLCERRDVGAYRAEVSNFVQWR